MDHFIIPNTSEIDQVYLPILIDKKKQRDNHIFDEIIRQCPELDLRDQFVSQKKELFRIQSPQNRLSSDELETRFDEWRLGKNIDTEGIWVYYPWSKRLIHVLEKEEFILLRTSRNQHKISKAEQEKLLKKKIGIIGLSVGSAVALTIAMERTCGKLKLADYDIIELSNLNRIKTGIQNLGLNKCVVTAREISEIDPFIEIECFTSGITEENISDFMTRGGKLDILVDECDDIEIKILCRIAGKELAIPVVMETSDRGMLDVERFDLETNRPIFHGLLNDLPEDKLRNISPQQRIPMVMKIVDVAQSSYRARLSLLEIGHTISTWPQLASAVSLGGAVVTDTCRRILLEQFNTSGRFYVDLEQIITDSETLEKDAPATVAPFDRKNAIAIVDSLDGNEYSVDPGAENIRKIIDAASQAPSSGNNQPWKWLYRHGKLYLFHDAARSFSFNNFQNSASYLALGSAYQNVVLKSNQLGFNIKTDLFPFGEKHSLAAAIRFVTKDNTGSDGVYTPDLTDFIYTRTTNRNSGSSLPLADQDYAILKNTAESVSGVRLHFISSSAEIAQMATLTGECDLVTMLNDQGHFDFEKNIHWPSKQSIEIHEGVSALSLGLSPHDLATLSMIRDKKLARTLSQIGGGNAIIKSIESNIKSASCLALLTLPRDTPNRFFVGGTAAQLLWLRAEQLGFAVQPINSPISLFARLDAGEGLNESEIEKLNHLRKTFGGITNLDEDAIFLIKIAKASAPAIGTNRLPLNEILFMENDQI